MSSWIHEWLSGWGSSDTTLTLDAGDVVAGAQEIELHAIEKFGSPGFDPRVPSIRVVSRSLELTPGDVLANGEDIEVTGDSVLSVASASVAAIGEVVSISTASTLGLVAGAAEAWPGEVAISGDAVLSLDAGDSVGDSVEVAAFGQHRSKFVIQGVGSNVVPFRVKRTSNAPEVKRWRVK